MGGRYIKLNHLNHMYIIIYYMDKSKIYFFHNMYGEEKGLLDTIPENVIAVPFGWDDETVSKRIKILGKLSVFISGLPVIVQWKKEYVTGFDGVTFIENEGWIETYFYKLPKPWTWEQMGLVSQPSPKPDYSSSRISDG